MKRLAIASLALLLLNDPAIENSHVMRDSLLAVSSRIDSINDLNPRGLIPEYVKLLARKKYYEHMRQAHLFFEVRGYEEVEKAIDEAYKWATSCDEAISALKLLMLNYDSQIRFDKGSEVYKRITEIEMFGLDR